jgi:hypothetical protein
LEDIRLGLESLNTAPQTDEERREQFELKKRIVKTLVGRVTIHKDRSLEITYRLNLLEILGGHFVDQVREAGTYTRIPELTNIFEVRITL